MTTLTRVTGKVFGGSAPLDEIGQFGSAKLGTKLNTQDVATIQALDAYSNGWGSAIISSRNFPPIEEVTGALKTISYQACYLLQEGIPTYDINTEYSATSIVKNVSGNELILYVSKTDNNIGNALTDTAYWSRVIFSGTSPIGAPQFTLNFNATLPDNCIWLEGAAVSRTTYNNLFAIYGTTYGAGDGSTTFNLPDFRNRCVWGGSTGGYIAAGLPSHTHTATATTSSFSASHSHTRGSMNITGTVKSAGRNGDFLSGAFTFLNSDHDGASGRIDGGADYNYLASTASFNASNSWTGSTSSATVSNSHTHTITVASGGGIGSSDTIQPAAIKVRVYTRYQ